MGVRLFSTIQSVSLFASRQVTADVPAKGIAVNPNAICRHALCQHCGILISSAHEFTELSLSRNMYVT